MSLILAGLVVAGTSGALVIGRWWARRRGEASAAGAADGEEKDGPGEDADEARARAEVDAEVAPPKKEDEERPASAGEAGEEAAPGEAAATRKARPALRGERVRLDGFVCQLGDVLTRITGEEAWLAGGLVLSEEIPVAVLFVAPEAGRDCAVYVRARPRDSVFWLEPLDPSAILVGGDPPSAVEHGGVRFERARRLPLRPRRIGVGAPDVGDAVVIAEYASAGAERLVVLKGNAGVVRAYRGLELERASFEVIASGDTTLDS
ncbi:MAG: hypothetical protein KF782_26775 [Labilithrix sp.]|nr:hypothetical protein [Labilithrix sp.]